MPAELQSEHEHAIASWGGEFSVLIINVRYCAVFTKVQLQNDFNIS